MRSLIIAILLLGCATTAHAATGLALTCPAAFATGDCGGWNNTNQVYKTPVNGDWVQVSTSNKTWKPWASVAAGDSYVGCASDLAQGTPVGSASCPWTLIARAAVVPPITPPVVVVPKPFEFCAGESTMDVLQTKYALFSVLPATSDRYPYGVVYQCGSGKVQAQLYSASELAAIALAGVKSVVAINAWTVAQPVAQLSANEAAFLRQKIAAYSPRYAVPGAVGANSPVYGLKADGTRNTTAIAGVRVASGTACDASKRVGTTNYWSVAGRLDTLGRVLGDVVANCTALPGLW